MLDEVGQPANEIVVLLLVARTDDVTQVPEELLTGTRGTWLYGPAPPEIQCVGRWIIEIDAHTVRVGSALRAFEPPSRDWFGFSIAVRHGLIRVERVQVFYRSNVKRAVILQSGHQ